MLKKIKLCDDQKLIYIVYAVFILAASVALTSWATIYQDHIINMILKMLRYASYLGCVICIALNVVLQQELQFLQAESVQYFYLFCCLVVYMRVMEKKF